MSARLFAMVSALLLASMTTSSAQVLRAGPVPAPSIASPGGGIIVIGRAAVRVRPDVLRFTARFGLRPPSMDALLAQIDSVVQAFVKAGVDAQSITRDVGPIYAQNQSIELTINGTARPAPVAQLAATYQNVMTAVASINGVQFQNFSAAYALQDCSGAEEQARAAAIADAHRRAQALAHDAGVSLGDPLGVSETALTLCSSAQAINQGGALDMSPQPMVTVSMQTTVTYALRRP